MKKLCRLPIFCLILGIVLVTLGSAVFAKVEVITLLSSPEGGARTRDLSALVSIPEQYQSDTAKVEFWIDVKNKPFDITTDRYWKYPVSLDLASGYFHWINPNLSHWGLKLVRVYTIGLMQRVTKLDGSAVVKNVDSANIAGNVPVLLPIPADLSGAQGLSVVYIDGNGSNARLAVNQVTLNGVKYLEFANNSFFKPDDLMSPYYAIVAPVGAAVATAPTGLLPSFIPAIRLGETGSRVVWLQNALIVKGYSLNPDGRFGRLTSIALRDFQAKNGLVVDGLCGPKAAAKLTNSSTLSPNTSLTMTWSTNNNQYQVVVLPSGGGISWSSARDTAARMYVDINGKAVSGHLVTINSAAEEVFIYKTVIPKLLPSATYWQNFWIGATDEAQEGHWVWLNNEGEFWVGDSGGYAPNSVYANWYPGRPDNYQYRPEGQDFGELYYAKTYVRWDDSTNDDLNSAFIVEYEID